MPKSDEQTKIFSQVIKNQREVSDSFFINKGYDAQRFDNIIKSVGSINNEIRRIMVETREPSRFLFSLEEMALPMKSKARFLLDDGQVAAIDGTNALNHIALTNCGAFAVAVACITSNNRMDPKVFITETSVEYNENNNNMNADKLADICRELDEVREYGSWATAFREYQERRLAVNCNVPYVLIDGPIFTGNLLGQPIGLALYDELINSSRVFIGVIKDLRGARALNRWCAYNLRSGEGYVVWPLKSQEAQWSQMQSPAGRKWIEEVMPDDFVRVVYRPGSKSFAFECKLNDLPIATAILLEDLSKTINHEIPLLLETVDAHLRSGFNASSMTLSVLGKIQKQNHQMGIDLMDERDFR